MIKRLIDFAVALLGICLLLPILAAAAIAIRVTSRGPVFVRQLRSGRDGREFYLYSFRSMYTEASRRAIEGMAAIRRDGPAFKIAIDPRITPVGRWLRLLSIDRLPRLVNVLIGDIGLGEIVLVPIERNLAPAKRSRQNRRRCGRALDFIAWFCRGETRDTIRVAATDLRLDVSEMRKKGCKKMHIAAVRFWVTATTIVPIFWDWCVRISKKLPLFGSVVRAVSALLRKLDR